MAEVASIVYKPKGAAAHPDGYTRVSLEYARLIEGYGIDGDEKGGSPDRHLNIMSAEALRLLSAEGFRAGPGELGEQIVVSGLDVDTLPAGARLRIGGSAIVELVKPRSGCKVFQHHQGKAPELAAGRLGVMARVVTSGAIAVGDPVRPVDT